MNLPQSDRTRETEAWYQRMIEQGILGSLKDEPALVEHKYWKLCLNAAPYDDRWFHSLMLVSLEEKPWSELTDKEKLEHEELETMYLGRGLEKAERNGCYLASIPGHAHTHLFRGLKEKSNERD